MRISHPGRFLFLLALFTPAASAFAQETSPVCPASSVSRLRKLADPAIDAYCVNARKARDVTDGYPNSFQAVKHCKEAMLQARESARVVHAVNKRRQGGFQPEVLGYLNQAESYDEAARLLLRFHNYTNISLAASYRSRLKLRKFGGHAERAVKSVEGDIRTLDLMISQHAQTGFRDERRERHLALLRGLHGDLARARSCLEVVKAPLDEAFEAWAGIKAAILKTQFPGLVHGDDVNVSKNQLRDANQLQSEQQYVHDVLTDPAKRDWAYKLAEGCDVNNCDAWAPWFTGAAWTARLTGLASKTPVVGLIMKAVAGGLAGDLAMRQGLTFWQQVREFLNSVTPFGIDFFDTEVKTIERGEVKPFPTSGVTNKAGKLLLPRKNRQNQPQSGVTDDN